jgi:hypothetical protein
MQAGAQELSITGAELTLADFIQASGSLVVRWAGQPAALTLADGTTRNANQIWVAGTGLTAAVGLNHGKPNFIGLQATGLEFVLGMFSDVDNALNQWKSLSGSLGAASLTGIADFTLTANALALTYNTATNQQRVANFAAGPAMGITLDGKALNLSADGVAGELLESIGQVEIKVDGFVDLSGTIGLSKTGDATTGELVAVGQNINAALTAGSAAYAKFNNASFGLKTSAGKTAFELKNGTFEAAISGWRILKCHLSAGAIHQRGQRGGGQYRLERRRPELHLCRSDRRRHKSLCAQGL